MTKRAKARPKKKSDRPVLTKVLRKSPQRASTLVTAAELLGGSRVFKQTPMTGLGFHKALLKGFPVRALIFMLKHMRHITHAKFAEVTGLSLRTAQRRSTSRLNQNQSTQLWRFARVLGLAEGVFGGRDAAEQWLCSPTTTLGGRLPIDLLTVGVGAEIVEDVLRQLARGDCV
jgi:putative toxin-antitoxin system antitoxin component (TIGR02293 family)